MANKIELKAYNRNLIYRCIYENGGIARQEVAAKTALSIPTVIQNLGELEEKALIRTDGVFESTGGRRAKVIRCCYDAAYAVGIDITQNHLSIVIVDLEGRIVGSIIRESYPYENTDVYYDEVCRRLERMIEENGIDPEKILGVGISLPSIVDRNNNLVSYGEILNEPHDVFRCFAQKLPYRVEVFNDANSGGFAENWNAHNEKMTFYLMLSNSVGGAIVSRGSIYLGNNCRSGEVGHIKIVPGGKRCYCGQQGCANAYISARLLSDLADGSLEDFFTRLDQGEFEEVFDTYLDYLAITVTNLRMLGDCDIILGGYVGRFMDKYMDRLGEKLVSLNPYEKEYGFVKPCKYKTEASAVGAALPFVKQFIEEV